MLYRILFKLIQTIFKLFCIWKNIILTFFFYNFNIIILKIKKYYFNIFLNKNIFKNYDNYYRINNSLWSMDLCPINLHCKVTSPFSICKPHLSLQLPLQAAFTYKYNANPTFPFTSSLTLLHLILVSLFCLTR
jgi:hypothetical protein